MKYPSINIRVPIEQLESWKRHAAAAGMSVSAFIKQSVGMDGKVRVKSVERGDVVEARRERTRQLARIGNNLNQIARRVNTNDITAGETLTELVRLRDAVEHVE